MFSRAWHEKIVENRRVWSTGPFGLYVVCWLTCDDFFCVVAPATCLIFAKTHGLYMY